MAPNIESKSGPTPRLTFRARTHKWHGDVTEYEIRRNGQLLGVIAHSGNRWYWYALQGPVKNTLQEPQSAIDVLGCKAEARQHFKQDATRN